MRKKTVKSKTIVKKLFSSALVCIGILLVSVVLSCNMGLGKEVDLTPPVLEITSHKNLDYVGSPFTLSGRATDNEKVARVVVSDGDKKELASARIEGENWFTEIRLPDGEHSLEVVAYDANKNSGAQSKKSITVLVDSDEPCVDSVELKRPKSSEPLKSLSELKGFNPESSAHYNYFQNEAFSISVEVNEGFQMDSIELVLRDEDGNEVLLKNATDSFSAEFEITEADLLEKDNKYGTGRHYFQVIITATDSAKNENVDTRGWLCWYPESDTPKVLITPTPIDGKLDDIHKDSSLSFEIFDDDGISEAILAVFEKADWESASGTTIEEKYNSLKDAFVYKKIEDLKPDGENVRNSSLQMKIPGSFYLVALVKDTKDKPENAKSTARAIELCVKDPNDPIIIITDPAANTIPQKNIEIEGYTLDKDALSTIYMAWIPYGTADVPVKTDDEVKALFLNSLETLNFVNNKAEENGLVVYRNALDEAEEEENGYKKQGFSFSLDLIEDFKINDDVQNELKRFIFFTKNENGNAVFESFQLLADSSIPKITVLKPSDVLSIHEPENNFELEFKVKKENGLAIAEISLEEDIDGKDTTIWTYKNNSWTKKSGSDNYTPSFSNDTHSLTISKENLADATRNYKISAKDILGNEAFETRTVIVTQEAVFKDISCDKASGTYGPDSTLPIRVNFKNRVEVTGYPKLSLVKSDGGAALGTATYKSGSGTESLLFEYTVKKEDAGYLKLSSKPINLNGGSIKSLDGKKEAVDLPTDVDFSKTDIVLDGVAPTITGITFPSGEKYYNAGKTFEVVVTFSEAVTTNGNPELELKLANDASIKGVYQKLEDEGTSMFFQFTVEAEQNASPLKYNLSSCLVAERISDMAGNSLALSGGEQSSSCYIDTEKPELPNVSGLSAGNFNTSQSFTISGETDARLQYSTNGGLSWTEYTKEASLGAGTHIFVARQIDKAGNVSEQTASLTIIIVGSFPSILGIATETPDGTYPLGTKISFKLMFSDKVKTTASGASIKIGNTVCNVTQNSSFSSTLYFDYEVPAGASLYPISLSELSLTKVIDQYGNTASNPSTPSLNRPNLNVDSVPPTISVKTPTNNAIMSTDSANKTISLTFNEDIHIEKGHILIKRGGDDWHIPVVFTEEEFNEIYESLEDKYKRNLLLVDKDGNEILNETGQPVGPYRKTTHGLLIPEEGEVHPDTSTKYVLDFNLSTTNAEDFTYGTETIAAGEIRKALIEANYQSYEIDISDSSIVSVNSDTVTITLDEALPEGREWTISIPEGAFRDEAGNQNSEVVWNFWSNKVAKPVIRVDRYSHGRGAVEAYLDGSIIKTKTIPTDDMGTAPTGYARVRIDCETPGAAISYIRTNTLDGLTLHSQIGTNESYNTSLCSTHGTPLAEGVDGVLSLDPNTPYEAYFLVGDGEYNTAERYYMAASAKKTGFVDSEKGYEGAFKTTVQYRRPVKPLYESSGRLFIEGTDVGGGMPVTSGFPLRLTDPETEWKYRKLCYRTGTATDNANYYWISWEIVVDWVLCAYSLNTPGYGRTETFEKNKTKVGYGNWCINNQAEFWE